MTEGTWRSVCAWLDDQTGDRNWTSMTFTRRQQTNTPSILPFTNYAQHRHPTSSNPTAREQATHLFLFSGLTALLCTAASPVYRTRTAIAATIGRLQFSGLYGAVWQAVNCWVVLTNESKTNITTDNWWKVIDWCSVGRYCKPRKFLSSKLPSFSSNSLQFSVWNEIEHLVLHKR